MLAAPVYGLLDTGADYSTFPLGLARPLGVDIAACEDMESTTAGGIITQHVWQDGIEARLMETTVRLRGIFNPRLPVILLGREDFFARFRVQFDQGERTFRLEPV